MSKIITIFIVTHYHYNPLDLVNIETECIPLKYFLLTSVSVLNGSRFFQKSLYIGFHSVFSEKFWDKNIFLLNLDSIVDRFYCILFSVVFIWILNKYFKFIREWNIYIYHPMQYTFASEAIASCYTKLQICRIRRTDLIGVGIICIFSFYCRSWRYKD
jgi:hypothetical protein